MRSLHWAEHPGKSVCGPAVPLGSSNASDARCHLLRSSPPAGQQVAYRGFRNSLCRPLSDQKESELRLSTVETIPMIDTEPFGKGHRKRQALLWQEFFFDPEQWLDHRLTKISSRHPDFRHKTLNEALWLDNVHKPAWVDAQLAMWDAVGWRAGSALTCKHGDGNFRDSRFRGNLSVGYLSKRCHEGELLDAMEALDLLVHQGRQLNNSIFYHVLKGCMAQKDLVLGMRVHALALRNGHQSDAFLANHIVIMYADHGRLEEARQVFDRVAAPDCHVWASIILAHARLGQATEAITLYRQMRESAVKADGHIFVAVLKACAAAADLAFGKEVHADIVERTKQPSLFVGNCLVDMYSKCGSLEDARGVFDRLPVRDVVTWTAMIAGYAQHGMCKEALSLYGSMQQEGITLADRVTFVCLLQACGSVGALRQGKQLHVQILERGLQNDLAIGNCLVDMYAKCGSLEDSRRVFDQLTTRDVVTWNALLNGYAEHGLGHMTMQCFEEMLQQGVQVNGATFTCLLVACSHENLVDQGWRYFEMMGNHGIAPTDYHYCCMVDLLGRSGFLDEAENMLRTMPFEHDAVGWKSLLSACKSYGDIERGTRCFDRLVGLEPDNASPYVLLANIYANAGRWNDVERIESLRKSAGAWKKPAKACIEVNNNVHDFTVGEKGFDLSARSKIMNFRSREEGGHMPHTELILQAVSEQEKEDELCGHAEKLALAFGLLNTSEGTTLLVTKNLRMCNDCHSSTKIMSRLEKREIIVRDSHRTHHFLDGSCSCQDRY